MGSEKSPKSSREKLSFVQSEREIWHTYEGNRLTDTEAERYGSVNDALKAADFFEPVSLNNLRPKFLGENTNT